MDFKNRNGRTSSLSELLENSMFSKNIKHKSMGKVIKHSTIFSFWNDVVGLKFASFTKPTALKGNKLFVSAKSPVIVQELNLYKPKLLNKINSYSKPLGIEIADIILSYKNFSTTNPIQKIEYDNKTELIKKETIDSCEIDEKVQREIKEKIDRIKFLSDMQKGTLVSKIISTYKAKKLRKEDI